MQRTQKECLLGLAALMAEWRADLALNLKVLANPELTPFRRFDLTKISGAMSFSEGGVEQVIILGRQTVDWKISYLETDRIFWLTSDVAVFGSTKFQPNNKIEPFASNTAWVCERVERAMVSTALIEATSMMYAEYLNIDERIRKELMLNRAFVRPNIVDQMHERGKQQFEGILDRLYPTFSSSPSISKYISTLDIPELPMIISRKRAASTKFNEVWMAPEMEQQLRQHLGRLQASAF